MSQTAIDQRKLEERQAQLNNAEIRNKALVDSIVAVMNRVSGQIKDGMKTTRPLSGTESTSTIKPLRLKADASDNSTISDSSSVSSFTRTDAAKSLVTFGKATNIVKALNKTFDEATDTIKANLTYGGENSSKDRYEYSKKLFKGVNEDEFTAGAAFSQATETQHYAMKRWAKEEDGAKLPTVLIHIDPTVRLGYDNKEGDLHFKPLQNVNCATNLDDVDNADYRASAFTNAGVSIERNQILFCSTVKSSSKITDSVPKVKEIFEELCETTEGDYDKYGFETRNGVKVVNIYKDNSLNTFKPEGVNEVRIGDLTVVSDDTYVVEYNNGKDETFEIVGTDKNHDGMGKSKDLGEMSLTWIEKEGDKYNNAEQQ